MSPATACPICGGGDLRNGLPGGKILPFQGSQAQGFAAADDVAPVHMAAGAVGFKQAGAIAGEGRRHRQQPKADRQQERQQTLQIFLKDQEWAFPYLATNSLSKEDGRPQRSSQLLQRKKEWMLCCFEGVCSTLFWNSRLGVCPLHLKEKILA